MKTNVKIAANLLAACGLMALSPPNGLAGPPIAVPKLTGKIPVVETADAARLEKEVQTNRGKVVLINFWGTFCVPCVEEFPKLIAVEKKNKTAGMTTLFVSADEASDLKSKVQPFLKKSKVDFKTFIRPDGDVEDYVNSIEKGWEGSLPRTYLIDRSGRVREIIRGDVDFKKLDKSLKKLLAEKPAPAPTQAASTSNPNGLLAMQGS